MYLLENVPFLYYSPCIVPVIICRPNRQEGCWSHDLHVG
jgi:hypothetical protein